MRMLAENEKMGVEEWAGELNDEVVSKEDVAMATEEHLAQILVYLGVKFMLPLFMGGIMAGLRSGSACEQHAGLVAMAILTEGSQEVFKDQLPNIVLLITPLL